MVRRSHRGPRREPDPAACTRALEPPGFAPELTWYLDDTVCYDVIAADAAGLLSRVVDHRGLRTTPHVRRVGYLTDTVDLALGSNP